MWKKDTTRCLDVVRFLPMVPCFPHTSSPWIMKPTIYLDKANLKANIGPKNPCYKTQELAIQKTPKANFPHENSPPLIS
jgi:hypothetical protein